MKKIKVNLIKRVEQLQEIEVKFPIYRKQVYDYGAIYYITKVTLDKEIELIFRFNYDREEQLSKDLEGTHEYDLHYLDTYELKCKDINYMLTEDLFLGKGEYKSSKKEFEYFLLLYTKAIERDLS